MQALTIEHLIQNFFGMSLKNQILFIDEVKKSYYRSDVFNNKETVINDFFKAYQDFYNLFCELYIEKIKIYLDSKVKFDKLNSTQRRNLRYRALKTLEYRVDYYEASTDESIKNYFVYLNSIKYDTKEELDEILNSHFNPKKISDEEAEQYIELYRIMDLNDQKDFIEEMYNYYNKTNLSFITNDFPAVDKIVKEYKDIVKKLFGDDLYEYYQALSTKEKIYIINSIAEIIKSFETTYENKLVLDEKHAVYNQKMKTIDACQRNITIR